MEVVYNLGNGDRFVIAGYKDCNPIRHAAPIRGVFYRNVLMQSHILALNTKMGQLSVRRLAGDCERK